MTKKGKVEKHTSYPIDLGNLEVEEFEDGTCEFVFKPEEAHDVASHLTRAMTHLWKDRKKCPNCGGIVPEIHVEWKGRQYQFTCYKIVSLKSGKVLLKTNYKKFGEYCKRLS